MPAVSMPCLTLLAVGMDGLSDPVRPEDFGLSSGPHWQPDTCGPCPVLRTPASPACDVPVCLCGACTSSLDVAHHLCAPPVDALPVWGSVLALVQRAGRGQLGRSWHSPPGNLFAALRLPLAPPFDSTAAAPALGAFLATALRNNGFPVAIKWPNDLVLTDPTPRKIGGILLEERHGCLIAGIGLNVYHAPPPTALREGHALPGGSLYPPRETPGAPAALITLWRQLVSDIKLWYEQSPPEPTQPPVWLGAAARCLLWQGQPVRLLDGCDDRDAVRGVLLGLAPDGGLRVRVAHGNNDGSSGGGQIAVFHSGSLVPDAPQVPLRTFSSSSFFS